MHSTSTCTNTRVRTRQLARTPVRRTRARTNASTQRRHTRAQTQPHSRTHTCSRPLAAGNGLGEAGARLVAQQIGNTDLETMHLQYNHFGTVPLTKTLDPFTAWTLVSQGRHARVQWHYTRRLQGMFVSRFGIAGAEAHC